MLSNKFVTIFYNGKELIRAKKQLKRELINVNWGLAKTTLCKKTEINGAVTFCSGTVVVGGLS